MEGNACLHGHQTEDGQRCVCAYGWEGRHCTLDVLAACAAARVATKAFMNATIALDHRHRPSLQMSVARFRFELHRAPWTCDLLSLLDESESNGLCRCLEACAAYLEGIRAAGVAVPPILLRTPPACATPMMNRSFAAGAMRRESLQAAVPVGLPAWEGKKVLSTARHVSTIGCWANCSSHGSCAGHFCECEAGTFGPYCRTRALRRGPHERDELSVELLDLPAAVQYEIAERHRIGDGYNYGPGALLEKRAVYWAAGYFYATLVHDTEVVVASGGDVAVAVHAGLEMNRDTVSRLAPRSFAWTLLLSLQPTDAPAALSEPGVIRMHPHCPRRSEVAPSHSERSCCFNEGRDVCIPPSDPFYAPNLDTWNAAGTSHILASSATATAVDGPSAVERQLDHRPDSRDAFFDVRSKTQFDLFFVGDSGVGKFHSRCHVNCTESIGTLVRVQSAELSRDWCSRHSAACARMVCASCYSGGIRQYMYMHWRGVSDRLLIETSLPRWAPRDAQARSKFCLVAGGVGFDTRIISSVLNGCVPLFTNRFVWPPFFRVLRHERLLVSFADSLSDRQRLSQMDNLPAFLACYDLAHPSLLANLQAAWPAFVWGNGTAFEHTLLEVAAVAGKKASSALRRVLAVHGPRYVAEVTRVPLDAYSATMVPGLDAARTIRARLARDDLLGELLARVTACLARIPTRVGMP